MIKESKEGKVLMSDDDGHEYLIDLDKIALFNEWLDLDWEE